MELRVTKALKDEESGRVYRLGVVRHVHVALAAESGSALGHVSRRVQEEDPGQPPGRLTEVGCSEWRLLRLTSCHSAPSRPQDIMAT